MVLLLARFPVAKRRGTLPHRAVHEVAAEAESAATADAPASTRDKNVTYVFETG